MSRKKLYLFLLAGCAAGYIWLAIAAYSSHSLHGDAGVCLFKHVTHLPCPSCGSTRAILALAQGDLAGSLLWNPLGVFLFAVLVISPLWISFDFISRRSTLFHFYNRAEKFFKQKQVAIPAILLVLANWIWNIHKGL